MLYITAASVVSEVQFDLRFCSYFSSITSESLVIGIIFKIVLDSGKEVLLNFSRHECSTLGEQLLNEVIEVDLLKALGSDQIYRQ